MNILLSGGAGYIGSHVVLALIDAGHQVHIIDDLSTGNINLIPKHISFTKCNVNDSKKVGDIISKNKFDAVMHFAGYIQVEESVNFPKKYFDNNTQNSINFFNICKKNGLNNVIFSSTAAAYGSNNENIVTENTILNPQNPYAESKIQTENYLINNKDKFNYIILRYFNVAGADYKLRSGQISENSTHLIKILSEVIIGKRKKIDIYGNDYKTHDGTAVRDYIHVSDLSDIHILAAEYLIKEMQSNIFNCGYGKGFSVLDIVNISNKIFSNRIKYTFTSRRNGDVEKLISDSTKLSKYINWKPKYNNLETIIKSSVNWEKKINEKSI